MTEQVPVSRLPAVVAVVARTLSAWLGLLTLANLLGEIRHPAFDANLWWIDLRWLPPLLARPLMALAAVLMLWWAIRPPEHGRRRVATILSFAFLATVAVTNAISFWLAWGNGSIDPLVPIPLSVVLALLFVALAGIATRPAPERPLTATGVIAVVLVSTTVFLVGVPVLQMMFFGTTDYRRAARAVVVFGAKVNPPGIPSQSLGQRMATAVEIFQQEHADVLIVSGGVEPTGYDEAAVMRQYAIDHGVPAEAIVMDPEGVTTDATVVNTAALLRERGLTETLAVSHFYHLARIKLAYQRAGIQAYTVPSAATFIPQLPGIVAREIPAFWVYYLRAIA